MNDNIRRRLASIAARWNAVEERLKEVELFRGEAILAAVNELRYTGRRLADALLIASSPNANSEEALRKIDEHLIVAENYFTNAEHDLTDAVVLYVLLNVSRMTRYHGLPKINRLCPAYAQYLDLVEEAQKLIKESRQDRTKRVEIYSRLATHHVPKLMELQKLIDSIPDLAIPEAEIRRGLQLVSWVALIGSIASILSFVFAVWIWCTTPDTAEIKEIVTKALQQKN